MNALWRGTTVQRTRLVTGLVLFAFATTHFVNHALGLVSLEAMQWFDGWRFEVIRSWPGTIVLGASLLLHASFGVARIFRSRSARMPVWEAVQIAMGLAIPVFLLPHIVNTRVAATFFGVRDTYPYELARIWTATIVPQTVLMLVVWIHGCIGLHFWLRLTPGYRRIAPALLAFAVLIPFAAFTGVADQGRATATSIADPGRFAALRAETNWPSAPVQERLTAMRDDVQRGAVLFVVGLLAVLVIRRLLALRARQITIQYVGGPSVRTERGPTLLEISRANGIAHTSICGGRGRCSTCRVLVLGSDEALEPPSDAELQTLQAIRAGAEVRLACQARPVADVTIMPLVRAGSETELAPTIARQITGDEHTGVEKDLAVLFVDMRGFTALTERKLPFDVVYILNQFFATVSQPVYEFGGWVANYAGDGLIALFTDEAGLGAACRSAVLAAAQIDRAIADLNKRLSDEVQQPIRIAMGLHAGSHVVGRVGYRNARSLSVIGLAINVASRLETLAKAAGVQMALSDEVARYAGLDVTGLPVEPRQIRGLQSSLEVIFLAEAREITNRLRPTLVTAL